MIKMGRKNSRMSWAERRVCLALNWREFKPVFTQHIWPALPKATYLSLGVIALLGIPSIFTADNLNEWIIQVVGGFLHLAMLPFFVFIGLPISYFLWCFLKVLFLGIDIQVSKGSEGIGKDGAVAMVIWFILCGITVYLLEQIPMVGGYFKYLMDKA